MSMDTTKRVELDDITFTPTRDITAHDRCDSCGHAAAVAVAVLGTELLFCGHHYTKSEPGLAAKGAVVTGDRRSEIK